MNAFFSELHSRPAGKRGISLHRTTPALQAQQALDLFDDVVSARDAEAPHNTATQQGLKEFQVALKSRRGRGGDGGQ